MTTVIGWHVGDVGPRLARELGWSYRAVSDPRGPAPVVAGTYILLGYSAGCQGVRAALLGQHRSPVAVVTIDGTHGSMPPAAWQVDIWRALASQARHGDRLWLATTLGAHRYTESLKTGAYASTGLVLERALGLTEGTLREPQTIRDGGLYVRSYPSAAMDAPAHAAQVREALPALWSEVVVPWVTGARAPLETIGDDTPTDPGSPPEPHGHPLPARSLGERIAEVAREYLARGVSEVPGPGDNPQIQSMLYPCRRGGTAVAGILDATGARILGDKPADAIAWCAASRSFFVFLAGDWTDDADRAAIPHGYRCAVRELVEDARKLGTLRPADGSYVPQPGDAAIFTRNGANPLKGGEGHVSTVVAGGLTFDTIGGNEADRLRESRHKVGEVGLVAFIACG